MKIIITEDQSNTISDRLKSMVKQIGWENASKSVGGPKNLAKLGFNNNPMDFLNLFNDMDVVQSEKNPNLTLFRYEKEDNMMIYDRGNRVMFINLYDIWSFLGKGFGLINSKIQDVTNEWADDVYSLLVTSTFGFLMNTGLMSDDDYNLRATSIRSFSTRYMTGWRISTI